MTVYQLRLHVAIIHHIHHTQWPSLRKGFAVSRTVYTHTAIDAGRISCLSD